MRDQLRQRLGKTGNSIYDDGIRVWLGENVQQWFADSSAYSGMVNPAAFVEGFKNWLKRSELNTVRGIDSFALAVPSLGVTQALDQFHYRILLESRTLRMFRGEYPYNRDVAPFSEKDYLDDRPLQAGDAVIVSFPFSGSGDKHPFFESMLTEAARLDVPVFLDCAWFGTCAGLEIDLTHPAISEAAFSLTKGLTCGNYRSGIRLSRSVPAGRPEDRLLLHNDWKHGIHLNTYIGARLCEEFGPDRQFKKFREAQVAVCDVLGLKPSPCVHIATGEGPEWNEFSRDGAFNRINLRDAIKYYLSRARAAEVTC